MSVGRIADRLAADAGRLVGVCFLALAALAVGLIFLGYWTARLYG